MIGWLRGTVVRRLPAVGVVIVDAQGVGWELHVSLQTLAGVPAEGESVELWVHTNVREDAIQLFGFASEAEKRMFRMLTSVPKVGPRNAIAVLGGLPVLELVESISAGDSVKLVKIPGIGKKTAEQIVLTLADKVLNVLEHMQLERRSTPTEPEPPQQDGSEREAAARDVLLSLGWKPKPVEKALAQVVEELAGEAADQPEGREASTHAGRRPSTSGSLGREANLDTLVRAALAKLMER